MRKLQTHKRRRPSMERRPSSNSSGKWKLKGILARPIRNGSDQIARQILLLAARIKIAQHVLEDALKRRFHPRDQQTNIDSRLLKSLERAVEFAGGVDKFVELAAKFVKKGNGFLTFPLLHFERGRMFLKIFPGGETTVALCECLGMLLSAPEIAIKDVMKDSATVISALVGHRYGEDASEAARHILAIFGHSMSVLWHCLQVLDPINLPLMEMEIEPFHEFYEDIGLEELADIVDEHPIHVLPETVEHIKHQVETVEVVAIERKENHASSQTSSKQNEGLD